MNEILCPQCQAALKEGARFCHVCGYKVPEETSASDSQPMQDSSQPAKEEDINMQTFTDVKPDEVVTALKSGNIFKRAINIMLKPRSEWDVVVKETPRVPMLIFGYSLILSLIPVISLILGYGLIGRKITVIWDNSFGAGIINASVFLIAAFTAIIVGAVIINALAPAFKAEKNFGRAMQLTTYSFTPFFFSGALLILPVLTVVAELAGLYGIFVLLMGLPVMMKTPKNNQIGYFFASAGILFGIYFTVKWTFSLIIHGIFLTMVRF
ncbi:MAG TPA: YIP1 family protein [Bacteroidales bacterium]|nr:YIP1 family protein [Bacteroidales bacterium]